MDFSEKGLNDLLYAVASKYGNEKFAEVNKKLSDVGRNASYNLGLSITLYDLLPVIDRLKYYDAMEAELAALPKDKNFLNKRNEIHLKYNSLIEKDTLLAALKNRNNIATSVLSGARGKSSQAKAMLSTPGTYSDYKSRPIPVFSKESFADGIRPTMFMASTYGARGSVISTKCLDGETLVRMADLSVKRIKDIKEGEFVLGADKEGRVLPVKVINVFDLGEKDCYTYKFRFSNGELENTEVTCTEDHKFLMVTDREYKRKLALYSRGNGAAPTVHDRHNKEIIPAGKMTRGTNCSSCNPLYPQGGYTGHKHEPWARIIGLLIGDGSLTQNSRIVLSCADNLLIDDITSELEQLGHKIKKAGHNNYSWIITLLNYNAGDNKSIVPGVSGFVKGNLNERNKMLLDYGLLGHYAWEKRLPIGWLTWSRDSIIDLISGIFATDGSIHSTKGNRGRVQVSISIAVTSQELIKDIKLALSMYFGITGREEKPVLKGGFHSSTDDRVHPLYTLEISRAEDVLKFRDIFRGRVPGIKRYTLDKECEKIVIKQLNPYAKHMFKEKEHVGSVHCYDIEVDHPDHLFVLANGLITSNSSTAKGGDLAKQMALAAADMVVRKTDCGTHNGIALSLDDKSLKGRVLAHDIGKYKEGEFVTSEMIKDLANLGLKNIVARSPLTCGVHNGLCAKCVGKFYNGGKLPKVGDDIGALASTTLSEPITQMALSAKHTAGMTLSKRTYSGLETIIQFTLSPEKFKDRAAVATTDGKVEDIIDAPLGGKYVVVNGKQHYVPAGHPVEVKKGDIVEAGDFLSEGLGDAEDVVREKGLGEGRLYYANRLDRMLADSGAKSDKRSSEVIARGALRHVRITNNDGIAGYLPDDIVDYNTFQLSYKLPETTKIDKASNSIGKYLQQPALHFTIGTRITPNVAKLLSEVGYDNVYVDDTKPDFEPEMIRLRGASHTNSDWLASQGTSYLTKLLNEAATRGDDTNVLHNTDYRPRLAFGKDFGKDISTTGEF